jgi:hydroxyquinol 1,2-dioxygenase
LFHGEAIADAVLERVANASNPRARRISEAPIEHLQAFIRKVEPAEEEWGLTDQIYTRSDC